MSHNRILAAAVLATIGLLTASIGVPAQAASVQHSIDRSGFAIAVWGEEGGPGPFAVAEVIPKYDYEILILVTPTLDSRGRVVGTTNVGTDANIAPYGTFTLDPKLSTARLDVTGVPADCYTTGRAPACSTSTIDAHVRWTGVGKLSTNTATFHELYDADGFFSLENFVDSDLSRQALASGTINATALTSQQISFGDISWDTSGTVSVFRCSSDDC